MRGPACAGPRTAGGCAFPPGNWSPAPPAPLAGGGFASPSGNRSPAPPAPLAGGGCLLAALGGYGVDVTEGGADCAFGAGRAAPARRGDAGREESP